MFKKLIMIFLTIMMLFAFVRCNSTKQNDYFVWKMGKTNG